MKELRVAIGADLRELGWRWRNTRDEAQRRRWPFAAAAGFLGGLVRRRRRAPPPTGR